MVQEDVLQNKVRELFDVAFTFSSFAFYEFCRLLLSVASQKLVLGVQIGKKVLNNQFYLVQSKLKTQCS